LNSQTAYQIFIKEIAAYKEWQAKRSYKKPKKKKWIIDILKMRKKNEN
jgi:hypothetical protein